VVQNAPLAFVVLYFTRGYHPCDIAHASTTVASPATRCPRSTLVLVVVTAHAVTSSAPYEAGCPGQFVEYEKVLSNSFVKRCKQLSVHL
jgi:hypothetical protein